MTGYMRNAIFYTIAKNDFFKKIKIQDKRFSREQVAAVLLHREMDKKVLK